MAASWKEGAAGVVVVVVVVEEEEGCLEDVESSGFGVGGSEAEGVAVFSPSTLDVRGVEGVNPSCARGSWS